MPILCLRIDVPKANKKLPYVPTEDEVSRDYEDVREENPRYDDHIPYNRISYKAKPILY